MSDLDERGRRATVRTTHDDPELVAAALVPDDTAEMHTRVEDGRVVTTVERATTGGLASTVDDYVVNLSVAERTARHAARHAPEAQHANRHDTDDT